MKVVSYYQKAFLKYLEAFHISTTPSTLYNPVAYILNIGGKRLRPALTLMIADVFGGDYQVAQKAALSVEVFHNFSLVHDDIMDNAPMRRGKPTVHEKWNINTGILSGDAMLIMAYQIFESYKPKVFFQLAKLFSKTALEVCEGQQYDMDFETQDTVTIPEYMNMIRLKTAVLVGAAMQMGAIVANASEENQNKIYTFGVNLGIAFQLQDDFLDTFGEAKTFGKQIGGDIIKNKKTYLYIKTLEQLSGQERTNFLNLYLSESDDISSKIEAVKRSYIASKADVAITNEIKQHTKKASSILETLPITEAVKTELKMFGQQLMQRKV